jgi:hypothetical protein
MMPQTWPGVYQGGDCRTSPRWAEHVNASEQAGMHFDVLIASLELADDALNDELLKFISPDDSTLHTTCSTKLGANFPVCNPVLGSRPLNCELNLREPELKVRS